jgi:hypothetical protein
MVARAFVPRVLRVCCRAHDEGERKHEAKKFFCLFPLKHHQQHDTSYELKHSIHSALSLRAPHFALVTIVMVVPCLILLLFC